MSKKYKVEEIQNTGPLLSTNTGLYSESFILNYTNFDITIIDCHGGRNIIPGCPIYESAGTEVIIEKRGKLGKTLKDYYGKQEVIPGIKLIIDESLFAASPLFVEELNIVIALAKNSDAIRHPYGCMNYSEAAQSAQCKFENVAENSTIVSITANDPTESLKVLYTGLGGSIIRIPVQHEFDTSPTPQLIYVIKSDIDAIPTILTVDLTPLTEKERILDLDNSILSFVAVDEGEALQYLETYRTYSADAFNKRSQAIKQAYDVKISELKASYELDKLTLENQLKQIKTTLSEKEHELHIVNAKYDSLAGIALHQDAEAERRIKLAALHNSQRISDNNVNISDTKVHIAKKEYEYKLWHIIAAAAIPVIVTCVNNYIKTQK